jgi:hypothetical protein
MSGRERASQGPNALGSAFDAQRITQKMLDNWGKDPAQEAAKLAEKNTQEKLRMEREKKQIEESLSALRKKKEKLTREQAPIIKAQRIEGERLEIIERESARHERLSKENQSFRAQLAKEQAQAQAQAQQRREAEAKSQAQAQAQQRREAEAKSQALTNQKTKNHDTNLGKRQREEGQVNFLSTSWNSVTQWTSSLTSNSLGSFSLLNPFAQKASPPPIQKVPSSLQNPVPEVKIVTERPLKKQKTTPQAMKEPANPPKSTLTPSDYGQYYLDGLYKRLNNGNNNFNIKTIIEEKDKSFMRGNESTRVSYLNQRVAKWESELSKFGIAQKVQKKIQTDGVDSNGKNIKRDDFLIQYGEYLKENIKTLKQEAANNPVNKDRNNKLNHLIAFHYLELAKMVYAGSKGFHDDLTNIPSPYKGFLEYSVGNSKFISTSLIEKPISVKTSELGSRALGDIKYLETDIHKKLTGKTTDICTLGISVPFSEVAYDNQVKKITGHIKGSKGETQNPPTIPSKIASKVKEGFVSASEGAARVVEFVGDEILGEGGVYPHRVKNDPDGCYGGYGSAGKYHLKNTLWETLASRAAPASTTYSQSDARGHEYTGLGYRNPSLHVQSLLREAGRDQVEMSRSYGKHGYAMYKRGDPNPGRGGR